MRAVCLEAPHKVYIKNTSMPRLKPGQALLKIHSAGICGSDLGAFKGSNPLVRYPRILGHELSGEIIEICGENNGLKVGDRVTPEPYMPCGHCYPCMIDRPNCCEALHLLGVHIDGGMSDYFAHPTNMLYKIPDSMSWEEATVVEPLTIALHCLHRGRLKKGQFVAIVGAGAIGMLAAQAAIHYGANPILIDVLDEKLKYGALFGVKYMVNSLKQSAVEYVREATNGRMAELVVEASGATEAVKSCLSLVSYAGAIAITGWPKEEIALKTELITKKELDALGSRNSHDEFPEAIDMITSGAVTANELISKQVSIEEAPDAIIEQVNHPERYLKINVLV